MKETVENIIASADTKCGTMPQDILKFTPGIQGREIKERILSLVGYLSYFNEMHDKAKFRASRYKRKMELIRAHALMEICRDENLSKMAVPIKEQYVEIHTFELDGEMVNYNEESRKYDAYVYAMDRFASMFDDLKIAIMACQSVLSFDREEMKNIIS